MSTPSTSPSSSGRTGLGALVDAEARLDRKLADAKRTAEDVRAAARTRAAAAHAALATVLARERERVIGELDAAAATEGAAIEAEARVQLARFDAVRGEDLAPLARALAARLAALALEGSR